MPTETIQRPTTERPATGTEEPPETERETSTGNGTGFGRCPVCGKALRPRCRVTGEPKAPPAGTGYESRAKCGGCGTVLCYLGNYEWRVLTDADLTDDDRMADKMGF